MSSIIFQLFAPGELLASINIVCNTLQVIALAYIAYRVAPSQPE